MHLLIVAQHFWPETFRINDLCRALVADGHQITVLTGVPNYPEGRFYKGYKPLSPRVEDWQGIRIIRAPLFPRLKGKAWSLVLNYLSFALSAALIAPMMCREKYDAMYVYQTTPITQALPAVILKKLKRIPLILNVQDLWPESLVATGAIHSQRILSGVDRFVRWVYRQCDHITVSSPGFIESIIDKGVARKKISLLPNLAESVLQDIQPPSREVTLPQGFKLLFAGNMGEAQNFPMLVEAMTLLRDQTDIHLVILGDGRKSDWVKREIATRELNNIHCLGRFPVTDMAYFFNQADALLVSLSDEPIFALTVPAKVQSYMAAGKPIVAAIKGGGAQWVTEAGAGIVVRDLTPEALVTAVMQMKQLTDVERQQMGQRGHVYFNNTFSEEVIVSQFNQLLQSVVVSKPQDQAAD